MPGPPQQTTHGCHPERASMQRHMCKTFCWNATSFQILSTCQGHLTHLSDFRAIPRAPMVHQGMLIDWITVRQKTQFEEEVNKTTCPQQPVRLFEHFSPLAGDSAYLDLSETWVPQKSSCSLTKGPFWRTPNLETKPYLDLSIFATKSLQFWWSSQKSHPLVLNSVDVWQPTRPRKNDWWILASLPALDCCCSCGLSTSKFLG